MEQQIFMIRRQKERGVNDPAVQGRRVPGTACFVRSARATFCGTFPLCFRERDNKPRGYSSVAITGTFTGLDNRLVTRQQSYTNGSMQPSAPHWSTLSPWTCPLISHNGVALSGLLRSGLALGILFWRLVRVAACVCLILFYFTHPSKRYSTELYC